jgi:hypothetical protein
MLTDIGPKLSMGITIVDKGGQRHPFRARNAERIEFGSHGE